MAGLPGGQIPGHGMPTPGAESWGTPDDYTLSAHGDNGMPDPNSLGMGYLRGFQGMQKKTTRDGQPAKRRGPKPDSKPAQTRRQELNRQAQSRTHRERKEQYIKALELELSRLKEAYVNYTNDKTTQIQERDLVIQEQRRENNILRQVLAAHGIAYENELEARKVNMGMQVKRDASNSLSPNPMSVKPHPYQTLATGPSSTINYSPMRDTSYANGGSLSVGHSPGTATHHSSPSGPEVQEYSPYNPIKLEHQGVPDMPIGIFEKDPQLGIDFILQLEHTCRDHDEFLVRRSAASPDDDENSLYSGHALMATCPPPSHIASVPSASGGLEPTYEHKMPDASTLEALNGLLNLSAVIRDSHAIPGGQVTPVMALQCLRGHRNYQTLTRDDVIRMIESIKGNVRCYGFGAVMEDFELRDALSSIFATKPEMYEEFDEYTAGIDDDMYA
ncbi:uncharacterized protein HMPREF1541_10536 [Cyphellophora europaea CBS 101466]|uniref:BZIP domain-containing protein n=1 Tax=Cyphellophora europaea (strain CBS 101466) TaxID=1220924 RepID=W2S6N5_CYPE1|nr:uncharacterized protein HMPREF1541_10536 [Cyphellophora europaea CBS 101466]ETN44356.1 hypothetical protein HMPREF1541_10536 [Cyphellophora europaea CBS 101466]